MTSHLLPDGEYFLLPEDGAEFTIPYSDAFVHLFTNAEHLPMQDKYRLSMARFGLSKVYRVDTTVDCITDMDTTALGLRDVAHWYVIEQHGTLHATIIDGDMSEMILIPASFLPLTPWSPNQYRVVDVVQM